MDVLKNLLGGGQQQQEYQDFIQRYDQGAPWEGISDQEALQRYQQVTPQLPSQDYQQAAEQAFARMSPQERAEFAQYIGQQMRQQNVTIPDVNRDGIDDRLQDPSQLAQITTKMHQQDPGLLGQLLGGGGGAGSMLNNPFAKAALAGIAAMAAKRVMGR